MNDPRCLSRAELPDALHGARQATLAATLDLADDAWRMPYHPGLQPTAWDLAHIGWFAEFWLLRGPHRLGNDGHLTATQPGRWFAEDDRYDSARIDHRDRWEMPLPSRRELLVLLERQLEACLAHVADRCGDDDAGLYLPRLVLYHELMHVEALAWTRGIVAAPAPAGLCLPDLPAPGQVTVTGGEHRIGWPAHAPGFAFDNELDGRRVTLRPFAIDATPVRNAEFAAFVADDGYRRPELWPGPAGAWLARTERRCPERWRRRGTDFEMRWFDTWQALAPDQPVVHVAAFEAEAFARWRGRRLPSAAEWEVAAPQLHWGHSVWEWTSDAFAPYPGFRPGPYTTYSAPWFHREREVRGGAAATSPLLHHRRYRNFFAAARTDVFCGVRTAVDL